MKKYLFSLLVIGSLIFSSTQVSKNLYINDAPIWSDIPIQSIDEDCEQGCTEGEFLFDLTDLI